MNPEAIAAFLPMVAGKYLLLNVLMHIMVYVSLLMIFMSKMKVKRIILDTIMVILLLTVATVSIINGNPFNFLTFAVLSVLAAIELFKGRNIIENPAINFKTICCLIVVLVGIWYPHFVDAHPALMLLLSPMGIVPCPTLMVVLGLMNLYYPKVHKGLFTALTVMGAFYGITGVFLLKVYLDIPLLLIALYSIYNLKFLFKKRIGDTLNEPVENV